MEGHICPLDLEEELGALEGAAVVLGVVGGVWVVSAVELVVLEAGEVAFSSCQGSARSDHQQWEPSYGFEDNVQVNEDITQNYPPIRPPRPL